MPTHMSRTRRWFRSPLIALMALLLGLTTLFQAPPLLADSGTITGTVTSTSGAPLAGISVTVYRQQSYGSGSLYWSPIQSTTYTNSNGSYEVKYLATATYRLSFQDNTGNYLTTYYSNAKTLDAATNVQIIGTTVSGINAVLSPAGHITGTVSDSGGQGIGGATVTAYQLDGTNWQTVGSATTNITGSYDLANLPAGTYRVGVQPNYYSPQFDPHYYSDATTVQSATDVSVTAGQTTPAININVKLSLALTGRISGTVRNASNTLLPNIRVTATRQNCYEGYYCSHYANTDGTGTYTITGLTTNTDTYVLGFFDPSGTYADEYYDDAPTVASATPLTPILGETVTANAVLASAGHITGTVSAPDGQGIGGATVTAYWFNGSTWQSVRTAQTSSISTTTAITGSYDLAGLSAGTYRVRVRPSTAQFAARYYVNTPDIQQIATNVLVNVEQTTPNINVMLPLTGSISGTVRNANNDPLQNIRVEATHQGPCSLDTCPSPLSATTDSTGIYTITGFTTNSDTYVLSFSDQSGTYLGEYYNDAATMQSATPLVPTLGSNLANINAVLASAGHITGTVRDSDGQGVAWANVTAYRPNGASWLAVKSTTATITGTYDLAGLPTGTYRVGSSGTSSLLPGYYLNATTVQSATNLSVTAGQTTPGIDVTLTRSGRISGTVRDANNAPLPNIGVTATQQANCQWYCPSFYATTDRTGTYTITGFPTNIYTYSLRFSDYSGTYADEYYQDATTVQSATVLTPTVGGNLTGIDAVLGIAGHITGTVRTPEGQALAGASVTAYQFNGTSWQYFKNVSTAYGNGTTTITGSYDLAGLPAGTYRIGAWAYISSTGFSGYYANAPSVISATDVKITEGQKIPDIDIQLGFGGTIAGHAYGLNNTPLQGIKVDLYRNLYGQMWQLVYTTTLNDGSYIIPGLEDGTYNVRFSDPQGLLVTKFYSNAAELASSTTITITDRSTVNNIDATFETAGAIGGTVTNQRGTALQGMQVTAYRQSSTGWEAFLNATTNVSGTYLFAVRPGLYRISVVDPSGNYIAQFYKNANKLSDATDVAVTPGVTTANANVILELPAASGRITNAVTGEPIKEALVTLYTVPGWKPRTSPSDTAANTCESGASKAVDAAWSQTAPISDGQKIDAATIGINPGVNPQPTDAKGVYGWNVPQGCWYVVVTATGYQDKVSPVVGVAPAVLDLNLTLTPIANQRTRVMLPLIRR